MKKLTCLATAAVAVMAMAQTMPVAPDYLKPGDKVAILSLASTPKKAYVDAGVNTLKQWGYVPVVGKHVLDNCHGYAGTPQQRLDDLMEALDTL